VAVPLTTRPYTSLRSVQTVCGACFTDDPSRTVDYGMDILQGELVEQAGRVLLRRLCRRGHGEVVSLYEEDHATWEALQGWRVPARELLPDQPGDARPVPTGYADGLNELQGQHTCIALLDLTDACNLRCPTCFAESGPEVDRYARTEDVLRAVDAVIAREGGRLDVLMLSGGEPTLHPDLATILREIAARSVTRTVLNTNGIRVARDERLVRLLASLRDRLEVYLQYDGASETAVLHHRGADVRATKDAALQRLTDARVFTTLACTVAGGVNDGEVGAVVDLALGTDFVGGVTFQPVFASGRVPGFDPLRRITTTGLLRRLGEQTGGRLGPADFVALPCSHPDCTALTYLLRSDDGTWTSLPAIVGVDRLRANLPLVGNRIVADEATVASLVRLLSAGASTGSPETAQAIGEILHSCDLGVPGFVRRLEWVLGGRRHAVEEAARRLKRIQVKSFMDPWTMNLERLRGCCVHTVSTTPGRPVVRIPLCARETFRGLRGRTAGGMVPASEAGGRP
jgi:7,8-dihydro-6-hydroxymethylpterin dimethyltransferase